ncbi:MAG: HopJ type III effector protein [Flavobacteriaceae bacterium]
MNIEIFLEKLRNTPTLVAFTDTITVVDTHYNFTPTAFKNGDLLNEAGQNSGSCKLLAFSQLQGLTQAETLACFGQYYFIDVLQDPNGTGHQNIRNFIKTGFEGLHFHGTPLTQK